MKIRFYKIAGIAVAIAVPLAAYADFTPAPANPPSGNTPGPVWLQAGTPSIQSGNFGFNGDAYFTSSKAIRADLANGSSVLNVSNYSPTNPQGFTMNIRGDLTINGFGSVTTGTLRVPTICLNGSCRNSWPSGGSGTIGGSGTTGYLPIFSTASTLGNSNLYQNGTNIGVGTTNPQKLLHVYQAGTGYLEPVNIENPGDPGNGATRLVVKNSVSSFLLQAYGSTAPGSLASAASIYALTGSKLLLGSHGGTDVQIFSNDQYNAPQFTLTSAGNVGIGTTNPTRKFQSKASAADNIAVEGIDSLGVNSIYFRPNINATNLISSNYQSGSAYLPLALSGRENTSDFVLTNVGRVGMGTTNPSHKLSVIGLAAEDGIRVDASTYPEIQFARSGVAKGYLGVAGSAGGYAGGTLADSVVLRSENALHLVSNAGTMGATVVNGYVGIGSTNPGSPLHVQGIRSGSNVSIIYGRDNLTGYELYGLSQNASLITRGPNNTYAEIAGISGGVYARDESEFGMGVFGYGNGSGVGGYSGTDRGIGGHFENTYDQYNYNMADIGGYGYGVAATGTNFAIRASSPGFSLYGASGKLYNMGYVGLGSGNVNPIINLAVGDSDTGLHSAGDGSLDVYSNSVRTMSVRSGNIGLGTNDPYLAGMSNTLAVSRGAGGIYGLGMNYTGGWYMSLITEGQRRMTIMDGGKIGINKDNPGFPLTVYGPSDISSLALMQYNDGNAGWSMKAASDGSFYFYRVTGNTSEFYRSKMDQNTGAYSQVSDRDLKQDISKLTKYGMDDVMRLEPVTYSFKDDASRSTQIGFIAQDVQKIMPEFVSGKAVSEGGDGLSIDYAGFVPVLTQGMQEQQKEIDTLKAQNAELLQRLEALEAKMK